eukprot:Selendium_serpulae@DN5722_c1_g3_i1.p1
MAAKTGLSHQKRVARYVVGFIFLSALIVLVYVGVETHLIMNHALVGFMHWPTLPPRDHWPSLMIIPPDIPFDDTFKMEFERTAGKSLNFTSDMNAGYQLVPNDTNSNLIGRALTNKERHKLNHFLVVLLKVFDELQIEWMMNHGGLLGTYMCHDILAWDDDVDILVEKQGWRRLKESIDDGSLHQYGLKYNVHWGLAKVFFDEDKNIQYFKWSWPFADMVPYESNETHFHSIESWRFKTNEITLKRDAVFPTHLRPYGPFWVPSPRDPWQLLTQIHPEMGCQSQTYSHLRESQTGERDEPRDCRTVEDVYPFVWREKFHGGTVEILKVNGTPLYSVYIADEPFYGAQPRNWNRGFNTKTEVINEFLI